MEGLYIDDGFTLTDHMAAAPGLHPAVTTVYRPALSKERLGHAARIDAKDVEGLDKFEVELVTRHVKTINGSAPTPDQVKRIHPLVRDRIVGLVLSYRAAEEGEPSGVQDS
jgi:hypothetical protein